MGARQEYTGQFLVPMLAGMQKSGRWAQNANNGRKLDYFRARSNNNCDIIGIGILQTLLLSCEYGESVMREWAPLKGRPPISRL